MLQYPDSTNNRGTWHKQTRPFSQENFLAGCQWSASPTTGKDILPAWLLSRLPATACPVCASLPCLRQPVLPAPVPQVQVDGQSRVPQVEVDSDAGRVQANHPPSGAGSLCSRPRDPRHKPERIQDMRGGERHLPVPAGGPCHVPSVRDFSCGGIDNCAIL
jgi:hypothetical protein